MKKITTKQIIKIVESMEIRYNRSLNWMVLNWTPDYVKERIMAGYDLSDSDATAVAEYIYQ